MMEFIWDAFTHPEDHQDFYVWSATFMAHFALGVITYALCLLASARMAPLLSAGLWLAWEIGQVAYGASWGDLATDLTAELGGVLLGWGLRKGSWMAVAGPLAAVFILWSRRRRR